MVVCRLVVRFFIIGMIALLASALQQSVAHAVGVQNGIVTPTADAELAGVVEVAGIAQHATFRKWQLDLLVDGDATRTRFIAVGEKMQSTADTLTALDTARYPDGRHLLRLRVVYAGLNYDEYLTPIVIKNGELSLNDELDEATTDDAAAGEAVDQAAAPEPVVQAEVLVATEGVLGMGVPEGPRRVEVDLSDQTLTAWQGETIVLQTQVSTGKPGWRTLPGTFHVYVKLPSTRMVGPGYDTPNVPWTMYYFQGFALHGAYWHNNFGTPVSHGCVNLRMDEAELLFKWAHVGMEVVVEE